jgi:hypothetical protein
MQFAGQNHMQNNYTTKTMTYQSTPPKQKANKPCFRKNKWHFPEKQTSHKTRGKSSTSKAIFFTMLAESLAVEACNTRPMTTHPMFQQEP